MINRFPFSKKAIAWWATALIIAITTAITVSLTLRHDNEVSAVCSSYGAGYDSTGPEDLQTLIKDSKAIVIGSVVNRQQFDSVHSDDVSPQVKVSSVLKGDDLVHNSDTLSLCPGMGYIKSLPATPHPTILIFLQGKDGLNWVPSWGYFGMIPQNVDNSFTASWSKRTTDTITVDQLRQYIE